MSRFSILGSQRVMAGLVALAGAAAWPRSTRAQSGDRTAQAAPGKTDAETSSSAREQADQLLQTAFDLFDSGQVDAACRHFELSVQTHPLPEAWLNAGICRRHDGRTLSAREAFVAGVEAVKGEVRDPDVRASYLADFEARLAELEAELGRLAFRVSVGTRVAVDGQWVADPAHPTWLEPGPHRVEATAADGRAYPTAPVTIVAGQIAQVDLQLPAAPVPPAPARAEEAPVVDPARSGSRFGVWPWVLGGAGATLALASLVTGRISSNARDALDSGCAAQVNPETGKRPCAGDLAQEIERTEDYALATDALWISGALLAGAGVTLWLLDAPGSPGAPPGEVGLYCSPGGCALSASGRF